MLTTHIEMDADGSSILCGFAVSLFNRTLIARDKNQHERKMNKKKKRNQNQYHGYPTANQKRCKPRYSYYGHSADHRNSHFFFFRRRRCRHRRWNGRINCFRSYPFQKRTQILNVLMYVEIESADSYLITDLYGLLLDFIWRKKKGVRFSSRLYAFPIQI